MPVVRAGTVPDIYAPTLLRRCQADNNYLAGEMEWPSLRVHFTVSTAGMRGRFHLDYDWKTPQGIFKVDYDVLLEARMNVAGRLWDFRCPAKGCGRLKRKLFLARGRHFICRRCAKMEYFCHTNRWIAASKLARDPKKLQMLFRSNYSTAKQKALAVLAYTILRQRLIRFRRQSSCQPSLGRGQLPLPKAC